MEENIIFFERRFQFHGIQDFFFTFLKHYKKYKYNASDDDMALWTFAVLDGFKIGYHLGMHEALCQIFEGNKELADDYRNFAPRLYKQYLEDWKKQTKDKP